MKIPEEMLMAYADGELNAEQRAQVEQALAADPRLAGELERHRKLHQRLHRELDGVLTEPVPDRLRAALQKPSQSAQVLDLQARRSLKQTARAGWGGREWLAMAACLVAGVCLGIYVLGVNDGALVADSDGSLIARGRLATALNQQLAGAQHQNDAVQIGLSFRDQSGDYCRSFVVQQAQSIAGLACNDSGNWRVEMLIESSTGGDEYRQAGSDAPAALLALIEQRRAGDALDAQQEEAARAAGWRSNR